MTAEHRREQLMTRLLGPADPEVSCEECFELLDEYVELELAGTDADRLPRMPRGPREPARLRAPPGPDVSSARPQSPSLMTRPF
jgi:hypothetical protein